MSYQDYLKSDHWQEYRRQEYKRAGYKCEECDCRDRPLHVHHLTYARLGSERPGDTVVLCPECHDHAHGLDTWEAIEKRLAEWDKKR